MSEAQQAEEKKIRIALADDHPIFRDGLKRLLAFEPDFDIVAEAKDGNEVIPMIQECKPDVLLLDLRMPGLDGLAAMQNMQEEKKHTKVIVLTASDDTGDYVQAMKFGACGIVLKQTATQLLVKSIRKVYEGEIWLDAKTTSAVMRQFQSPTDTPLKRNENPPLSKREQEVVALVAQGLRNKEIAERLFISAQTVKNHLHNIFEKLGVSDRLELALYVTHHNIRPQ